MLLAGAVRSCFHYPYIYLSTSFSVCVCGSDMLPLSFSIVCGCQDVKIGSVSKVKNLKQNKAQSARAESRHKGVN